MNTSTQDQLLKMIESYGFENVLDSLLIAELNTIPKITRTEWLHALNRRINEWCFRKAIEK